MLLTSEATQLTLDFKLLQENLNFNRISSNIFGRLRCLVKYFELNIEMFVFCCRLNPVFHRNQTRSAWHATLKKTLAIQE